MNIYISSNTIFFFKIALTYTNDNNIAQLALLNHGVKRNVTCVAIIAQVPLTRVSKFLFSDMSTLKLKIIIIILPTSQPIIILPTARKKIKLPSPKDTSPK